MTDKEVFKSMVGNTFKLNDGSIVEIVNRLPKTRMYKELFERLQKNTDNLNDIRKVNSLINQNFEEILENSKVTLAGVPDYKNRHAKQNIVSFDTRNVYIYDGVKARNLDLSIVTLSNGEKIAYAKKFLSDEDINLTQELKKMARNKNFPLPSSNPNISHSNNKSTKIHLVNPSTLKEDN